MPVRILAAAANPAPPPEWFAAAFPFLFVGMWLVVCTILGWASGHMALLRRFPPVDERREETFRWASGKMRLVNYSSALHVGVGARGLHLAANALFRPVLHRGIPCIPWRELRVVRAQSDGVLRLRGSSFEVPSIGLSFQLGGAAGRAVERKLATPGEGRPPAPSRPLVREGWR